ARDMQRIAFAADDTGGQSGDKLLNDYKIDIIVMNCFDPISGGAYYLPAAFADPQQMKWRLVFRDEHELIYMRSPPEDIHPLNSLEGLEGMEAQCSFLVREGAPACTMGMIDVFSRIGDMARAGKWRAIQQRSTF